MPKRMTPGKTVTKPPEKESFTGPFHCVKCGRQFAKQKGNFPPSQSVLYAGNNYFNPWCYNCIDALYDAYRNDCGLGDKAAIRRTCMHLDIYWSQVIFQNMENNPGNAPTRMREYVKRTNLGFTYLGKTYDDTLAEEIEAVLAESDVIDEERDQSVNLYADISPEVMAFWGEDLSPEEYKSLQARYDRWIGTGQYQEDDPAVQTLLRQICMAEYDINKGRAEGKSVDKVQATLNTYLGSLNAKPSQKQTAPTGFESMPLGVGIQRWEETRPVPEASEEWRDVDGIVHYVTVWFIGHLCRMLKIDNRYSQMYEDEINKLTVERPEYEGDDGDTETIFDGMFGGSG